MSRGPGRVMRGVLDALADQSPLTVRELAATIYGTDDPSESQRRAVGRAVHRLDDANVLHFDMADIGTRTDERVWMPTPGLLVGRGGRNHRDPAWMAVHPEGHLR